MMDYSLLVGIHDCARAKEPVSMTEPLAAPVGKKLSSISGETLSGGGYYGSSPPIAAGGGDSSEPDAASIGSATYGSQPTPPDSPQPTGGAFAPLLASGELDLDDEFYAIPSRNGEKILIIFQYTLYSSLVFSVLNNIFIFFRCTQERNLFYRIGGYFNVLRRQEKDGVGGQVGQIRC